MYLQIQPAAVDDYLCNLAFIQGLRVSGSQGPRVSGSNSHSIEHSKAIETSMAPLTNDQRLHVSREAAISMAAASRNWAYVWMVEARAHADTLATGIGRGDCLDSTSYRQVKKTLCFLLAYDVPCIPCL